MKRTLSLVAVAAIAAAAAFFVIVAVRRRRHGSHDRRRSFTFRRRTRSRSLSPRRRRRHGKTIFKVDEHGPDQARLRDRRQEDQDARHNKTATLTVTLKKGKKYPYMCTVPGHAAAGMKGVFRST